MDVDATVFQGDATLVHIDPRYLDDVWPLAAPLLQRAVDENHGEETLDQLRARVAFGGASLVLWSRGTEILWAAAVEFKQYPNYRTAWVAYLGGVTSDESWTQFKQWARNCGASQVECLCAPPQARLFTQYGMAETYRVVRARL